MRRLEAIKAREAGEAPSPVTAEASGGGTTMTFASNVATCDRIDLATGGGTDGLGTQLSSTAFHSARGSVCESGSSGFAR
jgi:hypothetical protein